MKKLPPERLKDPHAAAYIAVLLLDENQVSSAQEYIGVARAGSLFAEEKRLLDEAIAKYPPFAEFGPMLVGRPLFQGVAYMLAWDRQPPQELANAWEFQNAAVKAYRRLAGV